MNSYCYPRRAPNKFGGKDHGWFQVIRKFHGGDEHIELDFVANEGIAQNIAMQANMQRHVA